MEESVFSDLKIADLSLLDSAEEKVVCSDCGRRRRYFCYSCRHYVNNLDKVMPTVKLPLKIDIIKHRQELDSKSTAIHAALIAPEHCNIHTFPHVPSYNAQTDVVVFPSEDSISVEEWSEQSGRERQPVGSVIFIDCTWNQIHPIINCPQLAALPKISMHSYKTKFWRPNGSKRDASCLSTIEAIYYFLKEYHCIYLSEDYSGQYDNLLMIFKFMYIKIKDHYSGGKELKAYQDLAT